LSLKSQRRLASQILKVGQGRVWIDPEGIDTVEVAITREEIRKLIHEGVIKSLPEKGVSRARAKVLHIKRKKGLRKGPGQKSGSAQAKISRKDVWMTKIRALRRKLREWKESRVIAESAYRELYTMAGSGVFKSTAEMERHAKTKGLWRKR
jgi:large subunit ribosomal protein L19e